MTRDDVREDYSVHRGDSRHFQGQGIHSGDRELQRDPNAAGEEPSEARVMILSSWFA